MKQFEKPRSVGWFKLAEYIERGEKERALGIYKLLSTSINNPAFSCQLEGDILLAFEDITATDRYFSAVKQYLKQNQINAAIGTLHHLILLEPNNQEHFRLLTDIYIKHLPHKIITQIRNLLNYQQSKLAFECVQKTIELHQATADKAILAKFLAELESVNAELGCFAKELI